jgi:TolB protein
MRRGICWRHAALVILSSCALLALQRVSAAVSAETDVEIVSIDMRGHQSNLSRSPGIDTSQTVSGTGQIAFVSTRSGQAEIYVMTSAGRNVRRVTTSPTLGASVATTDAGATRPAWSPDGTRIAFDAVVALIPQTCSHDCTRWQVDTMASNGSHLRRIAADGRAPTWAPDGRRLAFWEGVTTLGLERWLVIARTTGSQTPPVPAFGWDSSVGPAWSPSGSALAFDARKTGEQAQQVRVALSDGSHARRVATGWGPLWAPDGRHLAYIVNGALHEISSAGTGKRRLTPKGELVHGAAWSPSGRSLAVVVSSGPDSALRVELIGASGTWERVLTREAPGSVPWTSPSWLPSGKAIVLSLALPRA